MVNMMKAIVNILLNIVVIPKIRDSLYEYIDEAMIHFKSVND